MEKQTGRETINNAFYEELGEKWYEDFDHPIALLRAENRLRIPWIIDEIGNGKTVLDIGCGAGMLANALSEKGHRVFGIDLSLSSLEIARKHDATQKVVYQRGDGTSLSYPDEMFDAVCAMDLLEHVENPTLLIQEASRVLKPNGLFFFHTFNRNPLSYLFIIKGVDWRVPNAPKNMHVYSLFLKPDELRQMCLENHLRIVKLKGFIPNIFSFPFWKMVFQKKISPAFSFRFSKSLATGYCGYARKEV